MGVQERDEKGSGTKSIFEETMAENSPHLAKDTNLQIQEDESTSNRINPKKSIPRHIVQFLKTRQKKKI